MRHFPDSLFSPAPLLPHKIAIFLDARKVSFVGDSLKARALWTTFTARASWAFLLPVPSREEPGHAELTTLESQGSQEQPAPNVNIPN